MVEPLAGELTTIDEDRRRQRHGQDPDKRDEQRRATLGHASFHREHNPEEPITSDECQSEDARH